MRSAGPAGDVNAGGSAPKKRKTAAAKAPAKAKAVKSAAAPKRKAPVRVAPAAKKAPAKRTTKAKVVSTPEVVNVVPEVQTPVVPAAPVVAVPETPAPVVAPQAGETAAEVAPGGSAPVGAPVTGGPRVSPAGGAGRFMGGRGVGGNRLSFKPKGGPTRQQFRPSAPVARGPVAPVSEVASEVPVAAENVAPVAVSPVVVENPPVAAAVPAEAVAPVTPKVETAPAAPVYDANFMGFAKIVLPGGSEPVEVLVGGPPKGFKGNQIQKPGNQQQVQRGPKLPQGQQNRGPMPHPQQNKYQGSKPHPQQKVIPVVHKPQHPPVPLTPPPSYAGQVIGGQAKVGVLVEAKPQSAVTETPVPTLGMTPGSAEVVTNTSQSEAVNGVENGGLSNGNVGDQGDNEALASFAADIEIDESQSLPAKHREPTGREMLINVVEGEEIRIAIVRKGILEELYMERASAESHVGNIYKGRVMNVEPSIQAAFVDFGLGKNGFLHISDLHPQYFAKKFQPKPRPQPRSVNPVANPVNNAAPVVTPTTLENQPEVQATVSMPAAENPANDTVSALTVVPETPEKNPLVAEAGAPLTIAGADTQAHTERAPASDNTDEGEEHAEHEDAESSSDAVNTAEGGANGETGTNGDNTDLPDEMDEYEIDDGGVRPMERVGRKTPRRDRPPIQQCLRRGQEVIVQVTKEGIGTKGPTLTTYISCPGRYLVMMPGMSHLGVSRKIEDENQRRELRKLLSELNPPRNLGFIIRTAGLEQAKKDVQGDLNYLVRMWKVIAARIRSNKAPVELYQESDLVIRTIRDVFNSEIDRIVVDNEQVASRIRDFLSIVNPRSAGVVELYTGTMPIFQKYNIEKEIEKIHSRRVEIPNGGSLVIDPTEALVAIDVNSGRYREQRDPEMTAFNMNKEAVKEVVRQLRLRDLGGVVVIDFIDMREERHKREIERLLREEMKDDRAKTKVLRMSQFCMVELTRQRVRPSLKRSIYQDCPHCHGSALIKTPESVSLDVMRRLAAGATRADISRIDVRVYPTVATYLLNRKRKQLVELEEKTGKRVNIVPDNTLAGDGIIFDAFDQRASAMNLNL